MTVAERELLINQIRQGSLQDLLLIEKQLKYEINRRLQKEEDR
jgi:hypothetical protein